MQKQTPLSNDELILEKLKNILASDGYEFYNVVSITSLEKPQITTIIVNTGSIEIALEFDKNGNLINKEKIAR